MGELRLEFTFLTKTLRELSRKRKLANKELGEELAQAYLSTLADLKGATVLGEVPGGPFADPNDQSICWIGLAIDTFLEFETIPQLDGHGVSWKSTHRIKIRCIRKGGEILA